MNQENRNSNQYVPSPHVQLKFRWNTHVNPNTSVVLHSREDGIFAINPMYDAKNSFHIAEYQLISLNQSLDLQTLDHWSRQRFIQRKSVPEKSIKYVRAARFY